MEKQRQMTRQRLEAKRRKREEQQYEEDMAASIVTMAEKQFALIREKTMLRREGQKDTVSNGNRTEWSPVRSVIIRVITKSDDRAAGIRFVNRNYNFDCDWLS